MQDTWNGRRGRNVQRAFVVDEFAGRDLSNLVLLAAKLGSPYGNSLVRSFVGQCLPGRFDELLPVLGVVPLPLLNRSDLATHLLGHLWPGKAGDTQLGRSFNVSQESFGWSVHDEVLGERIGSD